MIADNRNDKILTREMVEKYISCYKQYKQAITEYENTMRGLLPAAGTAQYGIEAAMPKGSGAGHSDPVFRQATSIQYDPYTQRRIRAVRVIERAKTKINHPRTTKVFDLLLDGYSNKEIAEIYGVNERTIRREKNEIIDIILGEWNR